MSTLLVVSMVRGDHESLHICHLFGGAILLALSKILEIFSNIEKREQHELYICRFLFFKQQNAACSVV